MELFTLLEKGIWFGFAALGFAILFNVPQRTLFIIWIIAALGGLTKLILIQLNIEITIATFAGASLIGILSVYAAHTKHAPPLVFSIPAVIPMVPGIFAYRMMLGLMKLSSTAATSDTYSISLAETVSYGLKTLFILMALAVGVAVPMLISRKETIKKVKHTAEN